LKEEVEVSEAIEWEQPPDREGGKGKAKKFVAALRSRPGEWAVYRRGLTPGQASNSADYLKKAYGVETASRSSSGGTSTVYARYVSGSGE
jgi:hypothetical protein